MDFFWIRIQFPISWSLSFFRKIDHFPGNRHLRRDFWRFWASFCQFMRWWDQISTNQDQENNQWKILIKISHISSTFQKIFINDHSSRIWTSTDGQIGSIRWFFRKKQLLLILKNFLRRVQRKYPFVPKMSQSREKSS